MKKYHIELTAKESTLVDGITLNVNRLLDSHAHDELRRVYAMNADRVPALMESLEERHAIPEERLKYWTDPEYVTDGRYQVPRKRLFERNGHPGDNIYQHLGFLPHLRYFLFGADLPEEAMTKFEEQVGNPNWFTSGDYEPAVKCARAQIRRHSLRKSRAGEEFFKLCLDMGLGVRSAHTIFRWFDDHEHENRGDVVAD